eukprot:7101-Heterococcus_DN1.PRE.2
MVWACLSSALFARFAAAQSHDEILPTAGPSGPRLLPVPSVAIAASDFPSALRMSNGTCRSTSSIRPPMPGPKSRLGTKFLTSTTPRAPSKGISRTTNWLIFIGKMPTKSPYRCFFSRPMASLNKVTVVPVSTPTAALSSRN